MVGITVPFERNGTAVSGLSLADGTLGLNANADANAQVLGRIGASYAALGRAALLPTAAPRRASSCSAAWRRSWATR
jgi:hypothetical protein